MVRPCWSLCSFPDACDIGDAGVAPSRRHSGACVLRPLHCFAVYARLPVVSPSCLRQTATTLSSAPYYDNYAWNTDSWCSGGRPNGYVYLFRTVSSRVWVVGRAALQRHDPQSSVRYEDSAATTSICGCGRLHYDVYATPTMWQQPTAPRHLSQYP